MISAPITDMTSLLTGSYVPGGQNNKNSSDIANFGDIISSVTTGNEATDSASLTESYNRRSQEMNQEAADMGSKNEYKADNKNETANTEKSAENISNKTDDADNNVSEVKNADNDVTEEVSEVKPEVESKILSDVSEKLDISIDELETILENLGLSAIDLLNPQNVSMLVANVKADGDMLSLVTDENLGNLVLDINKDIQTTLEDVSNELGISKDELIQEINKAVNKESFTAVLDKTVDNTDDVTANVKNDDLSVVSDKGYEVSDNDNNDLENNYHGENESETDETFSQDVKVLVKEIKVKESGTNDNVVFANVSNEAGINPEVNVEATTETNNSFASVNSADIINQIEEHLKLQLKENVKEIQMQLNPENLGTVHLTLAARESGVTAQLEAQNESVKNALEAQIMTLKQNLEQQGVKVEAVEVTVASHEFERNLDQGNDNNRSQEEEQERLRKATRKLNTSDYFADEDIEELDEELQVTAKMMKADGNSMDYKV